MDRIGRQPRARAELRRRQISVTQVIGDAVPRGGAEELRAHDARRHLEQRELAGDEQVREALQAPPQLQEGPHGEGGRRAREEAG